MANVLVIFDVDGFLSYVKEDRLDRAPVKSFPCFVTCGTKPLLAEVLEVSGINILRTCTLN